MLFRDAPERSGLAKVKYLEGGGGRGNFYGRGNELAGHIRQLIFESTSAFLKTER